MGCCDDNVDDRISIAQIYFDAIRKIYGPFTGYEFADDRVLKCRRCKEQTWLNWEDYYSWLKENGIEILESLSQLDSLPALPKFDLGERNRNLFCSICKQFIPCRAAIKDEHCPLPSPIW